MTIEAIDNIETAYQLSKKYDVEMPIVNSVYKVLFENSDPKEEVIKLMNREAKFEDQNKKINSVNNNNDSFNFYEQ